MQFSGPHTLGRFAQNLLIWRHTTHDFSAFSHFRFLFRFRFHFRFQTQTLRFYLFRLHIWKITRRKKFTNMITQESLKEAHINTWNWWPCTRTCLCNILLNNSICHSSIKNPQPCYFKLPFRLNAMQVISKPSCQIINNKEKSTNIWLVHP